MQIPKYHNPLNPRPSGDGVTDADTARWILSECVYTQDGCALWPHASSRFGYGSIWVGRKPNKCHRFVYASLVGPIPTGYCVCHRCDRPSCCRPEHLFVGTDAENHADKVAKGRGNYGARNGNARLTDEAIADIRSRYVKGSAANNALAQQYGITMRHVWRVATGGEWKHVGKSQPKQPEVSSLGT